MLHPELLNQQARLERNERLQRAEARRLLRQLPSGQLRLRQRALEQLGELLIHTGERLKAQSIRPEGPALSQARE